jgi:cytochrome c oxidase subunit 2
MSQLPSFASAIFPQSGGSPNADGIHTLYVMVFILALFIFAGVEGTLLYSLFKYKAKRGRSAAQIHGNTRLEIGWTVGAAVILIFITVFTFIELPGIRDPAKSDVDSHGNPVNASSVLFASTDQPQPPKGSAVLPINVDGQQYIWRYTYPAPNNLAAVFSYVDLVVPVGMTVVLNITADDVAHSWWIPKLGGKMDAVPGYTNHTWFKIPASAIKPGQNQVVYRGQCAELCGRNHANMVARVVGMKYPDYEAWYQRKAAEIKQAKAQAAARRKQIQAQQSGGTAQ